MRIYKLILILACVLWPGDTRGQQNSEGIDQIVDTMVRLCVGSGRQFSVGGGGTGGAEVTLRSLDVRGNLQGEFRIDKSEVEGLVDGLNNAMTDVAADQAREVRDCLKPVRERLLDILLPPTNSRSDNPSSEWHPSAGDSPPAEFPSGFGMQVCGCWGPNPAPTAPEPLCASGAVRVNVCPGLCAPGHPPYAYVCM
jgi:hypothetical protein